jgi:uncharacterized protein YdaU (DUF1376 family)
MSKDTFFLKHDYHARTDEKVLGLLRKHGWAGYGLYWALIEMLYEAGGKIRPDYETLAYDLRVELRFVKSIIEEFDLFYFTSSTSDKAMIASRSVDRRLAERRAQAKERSEIAKAAVNARWEQERARREKYVTYTDVVPTNTEAYQERRGEEREITERAAHQPAASDFSGHRLKCGAVGGLKNVYVTSLTEKTAREALETARPGARDAAALKWWVAQKERERTVKRAALAEEEV